MELQVRRDCGEGLVMWSASGMHLSCCTLWVLKVSAVVTVVDRDGDGDWRRRHRRHWAEVGCHQY